MNKSYYTCVIGYFPAQSSQSCCKNATAASKVLQSFTAAKASSVVNFNAIKLTANSACW